MNYEELQPIDILLVEDNPGDVRLTKEALHEGRINCKLNVVTDGVQALDYLNKQEPYKSATRPDIILLDLNLPKMDGRQVLAQIKKDPELQLIPVIVLTTSTAEEDIQKTYQLHGNCFITKPMDLDQYITVIQAIKMFWLKMVKLPDKSE